MKLDVPCEQHIIEIVQSKRVLWVDGSLTHVEPLTDNYLKRQGAATEKQLDEYDA